MADCGRRWPHERNTHGDPCQRRPLASTCSVSRWGLVTWTKHLCKLSAVGLVQCPLPITVEGSPYLNLWGRQGMTKRAAPFRQADLQRALRGAKAAGLTVVRV